MLTGLMLAKLLTRLLLMRLLTKLLLMRLLLARLLLLSRFLISRLRCVNHRGLLRILDRLSLPVVGGGLRVASHTDPLAFLRPA
jgi:hypothetical protein